jgi:hypothetical protein
VNGMHAFVYTPVFFFACLVSDGGWRIWLTLDTLISAEVGIDTHW